MFVLITAAVTSQAYQLERLIGQSKDCIIFADCYDLPAVLLKGKRFIKIPEGGTSSFAHILLTTCLDLQISKVFPLRKSEISALAEARQIFDEYNIRVIVPSIEELKHYSDRGLTGDIIIKDKMEPDDDLPARGVFLKNNHTNYQLFTAD